MSVILTFSIASAPPTWNTETVPQNISFDTRINSDFTNSQSNVLDHYLVSPQPRNRSKSDTSTRSPTWDVGSLDPSSSDNRTSVGPTDVLPSTSPQPQGQISFPTDLYQPGFSNSSPQPGLLDHYPFSGKSQADSQFLSPDMALGATSLQKLRSDIGRISVYQYSGSGDEISYPPSAHSESIARATAGNFNTVKQQFLHPAADVVPSIRDHHRRSSSGSKDRSISGMGLHSAPGSSRASPYPSTKPSPLLGYDPLSLIPAPQSIPASFGVGRGRPTSMPTYGASSYGIPPGGFWGFLQQPFQQSESGGNLLDEEKPAHGVNTTAMGSKSNVAATTTAEASERRRNTDANFACPVPGCGSTFTRHFNLKGAFHGRLYEMVLT